MNEHGDHLDLAFAFDMDDSGFDGGASPDAAGLWDAVAGAAVKEVARAVDVEPEKIESIKDTAAEKLRSLRRKREGDRRDDDAGAE